MTRACSMSKNGVLLANPQGWEVRAMCVSTLLLYKRINKFLHSLSQALPSCFNWLATNPTHKFWKMKFFIALFALVAGASASAILSAPILSAPLVSAHGPLLASGAIVGPSVRYTAALAAPSAAIVSPAIAGIRTYSTYASPLVASHGAYVASSPLIASSPYYASSRLVASPYAVASSPLVATSHLTTANVLASPLVHGATLVSPLIKKK